MRNKVFIAGLALSLAALVFFLNDKKDSAHSVAAPANKTSQESPPDVTQASTEISVQTLEPAVGQRDFFLGGVSFADVKSRAEAGDAIAQRHLSEMYEDCWPYNLNPEKHFSGLDQLSDMRPESKPYLQKIKVQMRTFCNTVNNGQPIPWDSYKPWRKRGAQSGDLTSKIRVSSFADQPPTAKEFQSLFEQVSESGDPSAMFEFGTLAGRNQEWSGPKGNYALAGEYAQHAWQIAACRRGLNCSASSRLMRNVCIGMMMCQYHSYENFLYSEAIPQGARKEIEKRITMINEEFIQSKHL